MGNDAVEKNVEGTPVRALVLELTKGCNLRCAYCYYADREDAYQPADRMTPEVARQSVEFLLREAPTGEPAHLHFFGGEPFLNFPILEETVLFAEQRAAEEGKRITFEVTTNGTLFGEENIAFLNAHRVKVGVSFDGPPEVQDAARPAARGSSYAKAEPGIRRLLETREGTDLETHCSVVLTRAEPDVLRVVKHLEGLGFRKILLTPATDLEGRTNGFREKDIELVLRHYDALADDYEDRIRAGRPVSESWFPGLMGRLLSGERKTTFCGGGRDYLGVSHEGDLALCYRFYEDEEFGMGSVQEGVTRDVTRRLEEHGLDERTTCSRCWARYFCGGGCHHDNVTQGGELGSPNPVGCDIFRHSMGRTLEAWARLSREGFLGDRKPVSLPGPQDMDENRAPTEPFGMEDRPTRTPDCHVRELGSEKVVYEASQHEVCVLNPTAAFFYELCDGKRTVGEILAAAQERFDAPEDVLRSDVIQTLSGLRDKGLLG